ncbi:MAG: hypothetical protein JRJ77_03955 [Deltaproteobacteria bacterium]|nr:hypothetical protein [Deltaproteobacteria bacterium]
MLRFDKLCKRCRCFVENIDSEEIRQGLYKQEKIHTNVALASFSWTSRSQ